MTALDVRTLLVIVAALDILLAVTVVLYWRTQRVYRGFGLWTIGNSLIALSYVLFFLRGQIPGFFSIVVATGVVGFGVVLRLEALRRFFGRKHLDYRVLALPVLLMALTAYFTFGKDDGFARTLVISAGGAIIFWANAGVMVSKARGRDRIAYLAVGALFFIFAAFNLGRGIYWFLQVSGEPLLQDNGINVAFYLTTVVLDVSATLVFIAMNHQSTARELEEAMRVSEDGRAALENIIAFLPDATFVVDRDRRVLAWNRAAEALSGISAEHALGKPHDEVFGLLGGEPGKLLVDMVLDQNLAVTGWHSEVVVDGDSMSAMVGALRPDGRRASLWATAIPLRDAAGNVTGAIECVRDVTDRERAEELREESEKRYRALFERNLDGVLMTTTDGTIVDANPAACRMLQMTVQEILAAGRAGILRPGPEVDLGLVERRQTGSYAGSLVLIRKDGSQFPVECNSVVPPSSEEPPVAFVIFRDVSERLSAEKRLRESEARLVRAQAVAHVGNWELDLASKEMWASDEAKRIYGLPLDVPHFSYEIARSVPLKGEHQLLDTALDDLLTGHSPYDIEFRIRRADDGAIRLIHSIADLTKDESGAPVRVVGVIEDITERRRDEELLRLTKYSVDHAADSVFWTDPSGRLIYVSDSTCTSLGYTREELLGMTLSDIDLSMTAERWADNWQAVKKERTLRFESTHRTRTGESFPVEVDLNLVSYQGMEYNCVFARDITDRRRAETALKESEELLRQSQKMEAVGQLAGGIAHDFNNLLTAIIGYSDLVLRDERLEGLSAADDVREIKAAAERASALTRQILAFSRRQALQPRVVSLNDILLGMEPLLRRTLGEDVELLSRQHPELGMVEVDTHQFEQVLMNLAINARDAMPLGGRLIFETCNVELDDDSCRTRADMLPGSYVMLSVADTGVGMDPDTASHIFEPFFTTKGPGEGTGLGLSTVYGIVRQSGGSIDVYSEPGAGTMFKVLLPRAERSASAPSRIVPRETPAHGGETILVVEDDASLRNLVSRVLTDLGYTIILAEDAETAFAVLKDENRHLDLLLTDIVLPGSVSGDILGERAMAMRPHMPVLYMSGYTRDAIMHAERLEEGVNFIAKPFTPGALANIVREVIDRWCSGDI